MVLQIETWVHTVSVTLKNVVGKDRDITERRLQLDLMGLKRADTTGIWTRIKRAWNKQHYRHVENKTGLANDVALKVTNRMQTRRAVCSMVN